jgi:hypothetical protein
LPANVVNDQDIGRGEAKAVVMCSCTVDEQLNGAAGFALTADAEWLEGIDLFARQIERCPTGDQNGKQGPGVKQLEDVAGGIDQVFAIVQYQQAGCSLQIDGGGTVGVDAKFPADGGGSSARFEDMSKRDEPDPAPFGGHGGSHGGREAGFAHSAEAGNGDEPNVGGEQEVAEASDIILPAQKARQVRREAADGR